MKKRLITAAHPFIPVEVNLAHIAGTYLPADIYNRLSKFFDAPCTFITGVDVHGRQAKKEREKREISSSELSDLFFIKYSELLNKLNIIPNMFIRTDSSELKEIIEYGFKNLAKNNMIYKKNSNQYYCTTCDDIIPKSNLHTSDISEQRFKPVCKDSVNLENLLCKECGNLIKEVEQETWFMDLKRDEWLKCIFEKQPFKITKKVLNGIYEGDFLEWDLARNNYYGIAMPLDRNKQLYVWNDSLFAKLLGLDCSAAEISEKIQDYKMVSFFGKNILPYYSLVFPIILRHGFGVENPEIQFCTRGFCNFNESTADLLNLSTALNLYDRDLLRFYSAYTVKDDIFDFNLDSSMLVRTINSILIKTFGKFFEKASNLLIKSDYEINGNIEKKNGLKDKLFLLYDGGNVRRILLELEQYTKKEYDKIRNKEIISSQSEFNELLDSFLITYDVLSCYVPDMIKKFKICESDSYGFLIPSKFNDSTLQNNWQKIKEYKQGDDTTEKTCSELKHRLDISGRR